MSEPLIDDLYFEPTFLSEALHSLPHLSFSLNHVDNTFNIASSEYLTSLVIIGFLPVLISSCAFGVLGIHMLQQKNSDTQPPITHCHCALQKLLRGCIICIAIIIFLEILLHFAVLRSLPLEVLPETDNMRDFHYYQVSKVENLVSWLERDRTRFTDVDVDLESMKDLTDIFKELADSIFSMAENVRRPQLAPREMVMPFAQYISVYEWIRFITIMLIWFTVLVICLMKSQVADGVGKTSIRCGMSGLVFCVILSSFVLSIIVGFADACQNHSNAAAQICSRELKQPFLQYQYNRMCSAFRIAIYDSLRLFRLTIITAVRQALRRIEIEGMIMEKEFNAKWIDTEFPKIESVCTNYLIVVSCTDYLNSYYHRRLYAQGIYKYMDNFRGRMYNETWTDRLYCFDPEDEIEEFVDFRDDARQLCKGDRVIMYLLLQFLMLAITGLLFFAIVRIHISRIRWEKKTDEVPPPPPTS